MTIRKSSENQDKILIILLQCFCPSNSLTLKVSLKVVTINTRVNLGSKWANTNSHSVVFTKGLVQSRIDRLFFHDHHEKINPFDLNTYTQEDSYILKKLVKAATGSGYPGQWNLAKSFNKGAWKDSIKVYWDHGLGGPRYELH